MKKIWLLFLIVLIMSPIVSAQKLTLSVSANTFTADNEDYKLIYGKGKFFPEAKLSLRLYGNLYLWGSFGYLSAKGIDPLLGVDTKSTKTFMAGGLMYQLGYVEAGEIALKLEIGVSQVKFEEEIYEDVTRTAETSGTGFQVGLAITYGIWKNFYGEISANYNYAAGELENLTTRLGGFRLTAGVGIAIGKDKGSPISSPPAQ